MAGAGDNLADVAGIDDPAGQLMGAAEERIWCGSQVQPFLPSQLLQGESILVG